MNDKKKKKIKSNMRNFGEILFRECVLDTEVNTTSLYSDKAGSARLASAKEDEATDKKDLLLRYLFHK